MKKILIIAAVSFALAACKKQMADPALNSNNTAGNRLSVNALGATYYVDPAGSDTNNGTTTGTAWKTLTKVNNTTFNPGDQILFKCGGSWTGQLHPKGSGTTGSPVIIDKYGTGSNPKIIGTGSSQGILLFNQSYWEVNNLEVVNSGTSVPVRGIYINDTSKTTASAHIYIKNCFVHNITATDTTNLYKVKSTTGGIIINGYFDDILVQNCHVENTQAEGIRTTAGTFSSPRSTQVKFISNRVDSVQGDGIVLNTVNGGLIQNNVVAYPCMDNSKAYAGCWTCNSTGSTVRNNEVYGIKGGSEDGEAFDADYNTDGDIFEYNYSHDNAGGFMLFMPTNTSALSARNIIARYNISVNDCVSGKRLICYQPDNNYSNTMYNNVFYISPSQALTITRLLDGRIDGFAGTLKNNIIYCGPNVTVNSFCKGTGIYSPSGVFINNCFYPASITATNGPSGTVSGNISSDPSFSSAPAPGYSLTNTSACLNAGIVISSNGSQDFLNNTLPDGNPDIGAIQHNLATGDFGTSDDAYVRDGIYANINYGSSDTLFVKSDVTSYNRKAYLKFSYTAVTPKKVQSAILNLYAFRVNSEPSRTISVYTTSTESWAQGTIKWSNAPMDTTYVGKITVTGTGSYSLDVSNAINAQLAKPDHIVSFLLLNKAATSSSNDVQFYSKEAAANQPKLSVTY